MGNMVSSSVWWTRTACLHLDLRRRARPDRSHCRPYRRSVAPLVQLVAFARSAAVSCRSLASPGAVHTHAGRRRLPLDRVVWIGARCST